MKYSDDREKWEKEASRSCHEERQLIEDDLESHHLKMFPKLLSMLDSVENDNGQIPQGLYAEMRATVDEANNVEGI